jgi:hypothetical protein
MSPRPTTAVQLPVDDAGFDEAQLAAASFGALPRPDARGVSA